MEEMLDFAVLVVVYFGVCFRRWRTRGMATLLINTLMYIYLAFVLYFTLMPIITSLPFLLNHQYAPMNLTPFIDVTSGYGDYARQIALNIIMTIPFGLLFPLTRVAKNTERTTKGQRREADEKAGPEPSLLATASLTFLLSLTIEILQPLISGARASDVTDIITNVMGGVIGYMLYLISRPLTTKLLERLSKRG